MMPFMWGRQYICTVSTAAPLVELYKQKILWERQFSFTDTQLCESENRTVLRESIVSAAVEIYWQKIQYILYNIRKQMHSKLQ
jgi:hypothetical protein